VPGSERLLAELSERKDLREFTEVAAFNARIRREHFIKGKTIKEIAMPQPD
jgi:hypothetical protein